MKRTAAPSGMFTALVLTTLLGHLPAVESQPVRVVAVQSALRITVEASVGGLRTEVPVQLLGITLIGPVEYSQQKANELCPPGSQVMLQVPGERVIPDAFGVIHAWILRDFSAPVDPAASPVSAGAIGHFRSTIQVELIRAGWAVPEVKPEGSLPLLLEASVRMALEEARTRRMGAYSLPGLDIEPSAPTAGTYDPPSENRPSLEAHDLGKPVPFQQSPSHTLELPTVERPATDNGF